LAKDSLDHVIVANEAGLQRVLSDYLAYHLHSRTHLALDKDPPISRSIAPPSVGPVVATPQVGGLHHRYDRVAA
jgi:putative transposase